MHRLLYISTARNILPPADLDALLRTSRRNNAAAGITGLLIVGGRRFLQALEGPEAAVATTFERIHRDPRHFAVVQLASQPIAQRSFAQWSMGYRQGGALDTSATAAADAAALIAPIGDPTLRAYFTGFAETHAAA